MYWKRINALLKTSTFRFALMTMGTIWLCTALVLITMYALLRHSVWQNIDTRMSQYAGLVAETIIKQPQLEASDLLRQFQDQPSFHIRVEGDQAPLPEYHPNSLHHRGIAMPPDHLLHAQHMMRFVNNHQVITRELTLPNGESIQLVLNVDYLGDFNAGLFEALIRGILFTLILAILGSIILTRRSLKRTNQINEACALIMAGDLSHRLPVTTASGQQKMDDHDQMAMNINAMLDRIQTLMTNVQQVSDNIAHDLKSPLARLRTHLEKIQYEQPSEAIQEALNEADRMMTLFKSLLGIARLESMTLKQAQPVDMAKLLTDLVELYEPVAEDAGISISQAIAKGQIPGDADLLFQALTNVLDNALKFTPKGGRIRVVSQPMSSGFQILISDSGPGIPEADLSRVTDRFYRLDSARSTLGFGLGLSLVKAIVSHHRGTLTLSNNQGLVVSIFLPS